MSSFLVCKLYAYNYLQEVAEWILKASADRFIVKFYRYNPSHFIRLMLTVTKIGSLQTHTQGEHTLKALVESACITLVLCNLFEHSCSHFADFCWQTAAIKFASYCWQNLTHWMHELRKPLTTLPSLPLSLSCNVNTVDITCKSHSTDVKYLNIVKMLLKSSLQGMNWKIRWC